MVVIKSALLNKNIKDILVQSTQHDQSLFNYFISNIIPFSSTSPKIGKKHKSVKFSGINRVYLIHTIDEIKEFLPDMYWKYDIEKSGGMFKDHEIEFLLYSREQSSEACKNIERDTHDYSNTHFEKDFLPLTRNEFVYEPKVKYIKPEYKPTCIIETNKTLPILIPNYVYNTTQLKNSTKNIEKPRGVVKDHDAGFILYSGERPQGGHRSIENPGGVVFSHRSSPTKGILHLSTNYTFRDKVASCIFNTNCFNTNNCNDDVFKENTNSLPLILNELGINENVVFSYPLHSSNYKLLSKDKIPSMFDSIQCHVKV